MRRKISYCDGFSLKLNFKKMADALVYHDGLNEPALAPQVEWSVITFNNDRNNKVKSKKKNVRCVLFTQWSKACNQAEKQCCKERR